MVCSLFHDEFCNLRAKFKKGFDTMAVKNFSSKDVDETAEKIYASVADKSLENAYKVLIGYFADAKTKVIKQAILKVRLKVLLARIKALKAGIFDQKNILLKELVVGSPYDDQTAKSEVKETNSESAGDNAVSEPSETTGDDQYVTVSISEEVDILGTTFTKGMIVEVPVQQLSELIESGKAQVVEASKTRKTLEEAGSQKDAKDTLGTKKATPPESNSDIKEEEPAAENGSAERSDQDTESGSGASNVTETSNS